MLAGSITSLNGLSASVQTFATGTSGTGLCDFIRDKRSYIQPAHRYRYQSRSVIVFRLVFVQREAERPYFWEFNCGGDRWDRCRGRYRCRNWVRTSIAQHVSDSTTMATSQTDWSTFNGKKACWLFHRFLSRSVNTISIPVATSSVNGYLSSTDWSTFNNKQSALTFGSISTSTTGVTVGSGSKFHSGSKRHRQRADRKWIAARITFSSTDWTTFNNKQAAGNYITALTGDVTASGQALSPLRSQLRCHQRQDGEHGGSHFQRQQHWIKCCAFWLNRDSGNRWA